MKLGVVSFHAGGAEILSSFVKNNNITASFILDGPAIKVFKRKFDNLKISSLENSLLECDYYITGTGCASDLEWEAIRFIKEKKIPIVSYLDHWVNYKKRFVRDDIENIPDEVWVGDDFALELARKELKNYKIKKVENPYFEDIKKTFNNETILQNKSPQTILYVCENINKPDFNQFDSINYFLDNIFKISKKIEQVLVRPHPSEETSKYNDLLKNSSLPIKISKDTSLIDDIKQTDVVAGCTTMAMVVGLLAKRKVICCIPDKEIPLTLPYPEIQMLNSLV